MASPVRLIFLFLVATVVIFGLLDYLQNFEKNSCEMTYMYQVPEYLEVPLDAKVKEEFPSYGLYLYGEGSYAEESRNMKLKGIPVLFIPGNAGSHKQVRSLGSVALRKASDSKSPFHFNYFVVDYNEELTGIYGGVMSGQTEFAEACIDKILTLYRGAPAPPKSVVVVGHSMGGIIARGLFTLPGFKPDVVKTIITQATPHQGPITQLDPYIAEYYRDVNEYWRSHENTTLADVTVFSTGGGYRDILVRGAMTSLEGIVKPENSFYTNTMSVPRAWVSTDHLCHVWCKQIVLATKRAMFDMVDKNTKQMAVNPKVRVKSFRHHFDYNPGPKQYKGGYNTMIQLDEKVKWEIRKKQTWTLTRDKLNATRHSVMELPKNIQDYQFVAITNIDNVEWLGACTIKGDKNKCSSAGNMAAYANLIPPLYSYKKAVHLGQDKLESFTHLVAVLPKTKKQITFMADLYKTSDRHLEYNTTTLASFFMGFPGTMFNMDIVLNKSSPGAVFYNITLNDLTIPLQAYTAHITCRECKDKGNGQFAGTVAKLYIPWSNEDSYIFLRPGDSDTISLKLQSGRPEGDTRVPQLHLYLYPGCTYTVAVSIAWRELFGQFIRVYAAYLPTFMTIQVLMVLSWQLKSLDEEGYGPSFDVSHARWAQPWRVVPVALIYRFIVTVPEENSLAERLGLPEDDFYTLSRLNIYYAALPIMLYLTCYSFVGLFSLFVQAKVYVVSYIMGLICSSCFNSPAVCNFIHKLVYVLLIGAIVAATQLCGTIAIVCVYFIFAFKLVFSTIMARKMGYQSIILESTRNLNLSLTLLFLLCVIINAPPLITWAKNLLVDVTYLENDSSRTTGILIGVGALLLHHARFPAVTSELYSVSSGTIYISCVLMVMYTTISQYRISYFINTAVLVIAVPAFILSLLLNSATSAGKETNGEKMAPATEETSDKKND